MHPTLQPAHVIVGIKETPLPEVLTDPLPAPTTHAHDFSTPALVPRTQIMFSHTIKGQLYNMELLAKFLASENPNAVLLPRLIDYELLTGDDGKRTVGFGWFAGGECPSCLNLTVFAWSSEMALWYIVASCVRAPAGALAGSGNTVMRNLVHVVRVDDRDPVRTGLCGHGQ